MAVWEVSNLGNVKKNGQPYRCNIGNHGYYIFGRDILLHRAVAELFIPNDDPVNKRFVEHIDTNKLNCRYDNLRWVTQYENNNNAITKKKISETMKGKTGKNTNFYGKHHSDETRKKLSEMQMGENNHNFGKPKSNEIKQKMSESNKKTWSDPEIKKRHSELIKNRDIGFQKIWNK